jgi:hypothetical protein
MATVNLGAIRFNWKGAYNNGTAYVADDVVSSAGSSYICILASTGNAVSNATYWSQMSSAGTDLSTTITTQGDVLYRDGSGLQRLAKGTASQSLTMNSGATAPEWTTPAAGGAWTYEDKTVVSSSTASVSFTGFTTGKDYMVSMRGHLPVTDNVQRIAELGITGPTYRTTNYYTGGEHIAGGSSGEDRYSNGDNMLDQYGGQGNAAEENGITTLMIYDPANASTDTYFEFSYAVHGSVYTFTEGHGIGHYLTAEAHTAVKLRYRSGNIAAGTYILYSRANT